MNIAPLLEVAVAITVLLTFIGGIVGWIIRALKKASAREVNAQLAEALKLSNPNGGTEYLALLKQQNSAQDAELVSVRHDLVELRDEFDKFRRESDARERRYTETITDLSVQLAEARRR